MAIVIASMVGIMLVAIGVLVLAFAMHVVSRSPQLRRAARRWALAAAAALYTVRRAVARWSRRFGRFVHRHAAPAVAAIDARARPVAHNVVTRAVTRLSSVSAPRRQPPSSAAMSTATGSADDDGDASGPVPVGAAARR